MFIDFLSKILYLVCPWRWWNWSRLKEGRLHKGGRVLEALALFDAGSRRAISARASLRRSGTNLTKSQEKYC